MVHGQGTLSRKRRHAEESLDSAEDRVVLEELHRRRSRRSTVLLLMTMAMKRCEHVRSLCDVEYEEGDKKMRIRFADE